MDANQQIFVLVVLVFLALFILIVFPFFLLLVRPWLRAVLHGAPVPLVIIAAMRFRGHPPVLLIDAYSSLKRAGIAATIAEVESVYIDARHRISTPRDLVELVKKRSHDR